MSIQIYKFAVGKKYKDEYGDIIKITRKKDNHGAFDEYFFKLVKGKKENHYLKSFSECSNYASNLKEVK